MAGSFLFFTQFMSFQDPHFLLVISLILLLKKTHLVLLTVPSNFFQSFELSGLPILLKVSITVVIPLGFRAFGDVDGFGIFIPNAFNIVGNCLNHHFENINT